MSKGYGQAGISKSLLGEILMRIGNTGTAMYMIVEETVGKIQCFYEQRKRKNPQPFSV